MATLLDLYSCDNFSHQKDLKSTTEAQIRHWWIDHLLDKVKIKFQMPGRVRFCLDFAGDEFLHDYLRREVHKNTGALLKSYSMLTRSALVIYDPQLTDISTISYSILRGVQEFARIHGKCEIGEWHQHANHGQEHGHDHSHKHGGEGAQCGHGEEQDCGHDHSELTTNHGIRREVAKLAITGALLGYFLYRRLNNQNRLATPMTGGFLWFSSLLTIVTGMPIFKGGAKTLQKGKKFTDDTLIGVAVLATLIMKESLTGLSVVWLINLGRLLEAITIRRSRNAIKDLLDLTPHEAWRLNVGTDRLIRVEVEKVQKGQHVRIFAHERVPLDGRIARGHGTFQESYLTGESIPRHKELGDFIYAGSILEAGEVDLLVENIYSQTAVAKMVHAVEKMQKNKAQIEKFGQKFASQFVPISMGIAGLVLITTGDWQRAITALVIACPCAAGLATPTAISAAIGQAAKKGILIKGGTHLEIASKVDTVVFDKTGTLTYGRLELVQMMTRQKHAENELLLWAASSEQFSTHPVGISLVAEAKKRGITMQMPEKHKTYPGSGIVAQFKEAPEVIVGSYLFMQEKKVQMTKAQQQSILTLQDEVALNSFLAIEGKLMAIFVFKDQIRPEAKSVIRTLRAQGVKNIILLTGDKEAVAFDVAQQLGITEVVANALPQQKFEAIEKLKARGFTVAMVGDGVNDAQALVAAHISCAMPSTRCDLAIEAADITLSNSNLALVPETLQIAHKTFRTIRTNFVVSVGVNGVGLLLGAQGKLSPFFAAIVHNMSTLAVVMNSFKLRNDIKSNLEKNIVS